MKITKEKLQQIIREELGALQNEMAKNPLADIEGYTSAGHGAAEVAAEKDDWGGGTAADALFMKLQDKLAMWLANKNPASESAVRKYAMTMRKSTKWWKPEDVNIMRKHISSSPKFAQLQSCMQGSKFAKSI